VPATRKKKRIEKLKLVLHEAKSMLIVMQDYPDPDAIAAAAALRELANSLASVPCTIACGAAIGRAENLALAKYLGLNLHHLSDLSLARFDRIAMVDTQPGTGNNPLPADVVPDIVFDHHPIRRDTRKARFTDVRSRVGATSTILFEYLQTAEITPDTPLITALVYAIKTDTQDFGEEATRADIKAYVTLYPHANIRMLSRIQDADLPHAYFRALAGALRNAQVFGKGILCNLGDLDNPDMIAEVADLLLRCEDVFYVLCHGVFENRILLSLRTGDDATNAGAVIRRFVGAHGTGGGHRAMAGGQIPLHDGTAAERRRLENHIRKHFLTFLKAERVTPVPLV